MFGFDSRLWDVHRLAAFIIEASFAAIPFALIVAYIGNRLIAASDSRETQLKAESKRSVFWPAVAVLILFTALGLAFRVDPPLITRIYASRPKTKPSQQITVLVNRHSGYYYCPDPNGHGKSQHGTYMQKRTPFSVDTARCPANLVKTWFSRFGNKFTD